MHPLSFRLLASSFLFALTAVEASAQSNVLVVIADDFGMESTRCYGLGLDSTPTPTIDSLAANGVRFTRAYVNPACSPTRGCIQTGRYGFRNGVPTTMGATDAGLNTNEVILPVALQNSGYARALIGKWHVGARYGNNTPNALGWPHFVGVMDGGVGDYRAWPKVVNGVPGWSTNYMTTDQVNDALSWINSRTTPWMLMLSFCAPHQPFHTPPAHLHTRNLAGLDPATNPRPFYNAMVEAMDTELGRLLGSMSSSVRANTNIIFLGDNGTDGAVAVAPFVPQKLKGTLYEGGIRVPMIVNGPAVAAPGRTSSALVSAVDLFPTVLDLCGVAPSAIPPSPAGPLDGVSIRPLLANTATTVRSYVYADMFYGPFGGGYVVVEDQYALLRVLRTGTQRQELYRVDTDPLENANLLALDSARPQSSADLVAYQRLTGILDTLHPNEAWVENVGASCTSPAIPTPALRSQTMPRIGTPHILQVLNVRPEATSILFSVGWTGNTTSALGTLPLPLAPYGMTNCFAYTFSDLGLVPQPNQLATGNYFASPLPFVPALIGLRLTTQAYVADAAANAAGLLPTNAQNIVIGS